MNLEDALQKHAEWGLKLREAIARKEKLDAHLFARRNSCVLGEWLHVEGMSRLAGSAELALAVAAHNAFHAEAARVATLINTKQFKDAERQLEDGSAYTQASNEVAATMVMLQKIAA